MVQSDRRTDLDFLRGVGILGTFWTNVFYFGGVLPSMATATADRVAMSAMGAFAMGKFYVLLAMLFGMGVEIQRRRAEHGGRAWPGAFVRRNAVLLGIGLTHGAVLLGPDVLAGYAMSGFVLASLVTLPSRSLWFWMAGLLAVGLAVAALGGDTGAKGLVGAQGLAEALAAGQAGIYPATLAGHFEAGWRALAAGFLGAGLLTLFVVPFGLFGVLVLRSGFLEDPQRAGDFGTVLTWVGGAGLILATVQFVVLAGGLLAPAFIRWGAVLAPLVAVGYLGFGASWCRRGGRMVQWLAAVGRTALSCYLLQSVLALAWFSPLLLGWQGHVGPVGLVAVLAAVWGASLWAAPRWLARYGTGPIELLWGRLSSGGKRTAPGGDPRLART